MIFENLHINRNLVILSSQDSCNNCTQQKTVRGLKWINLQSSKLNSRAVDLKIQWECRPGFLEKEILLFPQIFLSYSLISIRQNYNFDMLASIWHEIVSWFLTISQDFPGYIWATWSLNCFCFDLHTYQCRTVSWSQQTRTRKNP